MSLAVELHGEPVSIILLFFVSTILLSQEKVTIFFVVSRLPGLDRQSSIVVYSAGGDCIWQMYSQ